MLQSEESKLCCTPSSCFSTLECPLSSLLPFVFSYVEYSTTQQSFAGPNRSGHGVACRRPEAAEMIAANAWKPDSGSH